MAWKDSNRAIFEKKLYPERDCLICNTSFRPSEQTRVTCSEACRVIRRRRRNNEATLRYKRRKRGLED